eukprot:366512-Chlamydomonas_euryale.AAC.2
MLEQRCQGQSFCAVSEAAVLEATGDPCWGTPKYIEAAYTCVEGRCCTQAHSYRGALPSEALGSIFNILACCSIMLAR